MVHLPPQMNDNLKTVIVISHVLIVRALVKSA